jgi:hypothetical protein
MLMPMVPFSGQMSYCLIKSIQMVLAYQGHEYSLPWLECVSGEPFGFIYVQSPGPIFAADGYVYHRAGEHLLRTLNYDYTYRGFADAETAVDALQIALQSGPVVAGMLDMGYLTYDPDHTNSRGSDHAVVILGIESNTLIIHDPGGYVAVRMSIPDFIEAWRRDVYTGKPFGLWQIGSQKQPPTPETIWEETIKRARENFTWTMEVINPEVTLLYGPNAIRQLAKDLQADPDRDLSILKYFGWRVSAQRCLDSAFFIQDRLPEAAQIRWREAQIYGSLQTVTATSHKDQLPSLVEELAETEDAFIAALQ